MKKQPWQRQLDAGGLVPAKAKCDAATTETIVARTYSAAALGQRVVVKLSSDRLVAAEDLAMEYLGFQPQAISPPIAQQHRTALDFAHWALIHQPQQARYALDLVKRMKGAERRAAAKPGHAWDLYAAMADELNKSVRHFLPAFWEQVARSFKSLGNLTYAGRAFNKALEAERVHALEVAREHRRDAVLEFSLGGCLSGKALSDYSKDLAVQFPAQEAYETYRDLLIRRTMGGMAPTGNAGTDLIRLAKAASLDVDAEVESFLEAIIRSPAMVRAPLQFWKSVQKQAGQIARRSDSFAVWLLAHTNPQPRYDDDSLVWAWLDLLEAWDVLPWLWKPADQLPRDVEIPGGRAGWISRLATVEQSPAKRVFELLEAMADVLVAEARPVNLKPASRWQKWVDVDVLEACLQLGIPVSDETAQCELDFSGWLREFPDHPRRNSQLEALVADSRFTHALTGAMEELVTFKGETATARSYGRNVAQRRSFEAAVVDHPVVKRFWWRFLEQRLQELESGGLFELETVLSQLRKCVGTGTVIQFPELTARLEKIDVVDHLQRSLLAGVFDEYGWEALDRQADEFPMLRTRDRYNRRYDLAFPWLAYHSQGEVHVVGPESAQPGRSLVLKKGHTLQHLLPIGDDVIVVFQDDHWKSYWRWLSQKPEVAKPTEIYFGYHSVQPMARLSDGSWFTGVRTMMPGDEKLVAFDDNWFCDGTRVWKFEESFAVWSDESLEKQLADQRCRELDPHSGKPIRDSIPPFFEQQLPAGARIVYSCSTLLPCPPMSGKSPLGTRDGLIGWRVVRRRDGTIQAMGVDGRMVTMDAAEQAADGFVAPVALMDKPAVDGYWMVNNQGEVIDQATKVLISGVSLEKYQAGQSFELEPLYFHFMRVRHPASSRKLRTVKRKQAEGLLEAGSIELEAKKQKENPDAPDPNRMAGATAVAAWLKEAPARLVQGVSSLLQIAAGERLTLTKLVTFCQQANSNDLQAAADAAQQQAISERANEGLSQLKPQLDFDVIETIYSYGHRAQCPNAVEHLQAVGRFLRGADTEELPPIDFNWFALLTDTVGVAYRCFWETVTNEELGSSVSQRLHTPWLDALRMFADCGLLRFVDGLCLYVGPAAGSKSTGKQAKAGLGDQVEAGKPMGLVSGDSRYVVYRFDHYLDDHLVVLERSLKNKPKPPKGMVVEQTIPVTRSWSAASLKAFVKAVEKIEAIPLPDPQDIAQAAEELGMHPIATAITFMGNLRTTPYGQEKLTKEIRDRYRWKVKDIQVALAQLEAQPAPPNVGCAFARANPSNPFGEKLSMAVRRMVMAWQAERELSATATASVPPELAVVLERVNKGDRTFSTKRFAELISAPAQAGDLRPRKAKIMLSDRKRDYEPLKVQYDPAWSLEGATFLRHLERSIAVTAYMLPAGHELRRRIPELIRSVRKLLDHPDTMLPFGGGCSQLDSYATVDTETALSNFGQLVGRLEKASQGIHQADDGLIVVGLVPPHVVCLFRTSCLKTEADFQRIRAVAAVTYDYQISGESRLDAAVSVQNFRSEAFQRIHDGNERSPVPDGKWDQDPRLSAPETVAAVAQQYSLSPEAAAFYLQLLTLPDPTTKNIRHWNQWSAKQLQQAGQELLEQELVVQAKRSRAGRDLFLPGGWEALALPNLPIESWKLPLYGYESIDAFRGYYAELICCGDTLCHLFQTAWQRVTQGDPPRYEEAQLPKKRKR